ncbi:MAG: hypothetical protein WC721_03590 [Victivallaceae bacterium]
MLNDTPKCRNAEARECGSGKLAQLAGPANAGEKSEKSCERRKCRTRGQNVRNAAGEKSGDRSQDSEWEPVNQKAKTKCIVLNDTPRSRNAEAANAGEKSENQKPLCSTTLQSVGVRGSPRMRE